MGFLLQLTGEGSVGMYFRLCPRQGSTVRKVQVRLCFQQRSPTLTTTVADRPPPWHCTGRC